MSSFSANTGELSFFYHQWVHRSTDIDTTDTVSSLISMRSWTLRHGLGQTTAILWFYSYSSMNSSQMSTSILPRNKKSMPQCSIEHRYQCLLSGGVSRHAPNPGTDGKTRVRSFPVPKCKA
jgi:hypothetical protein